MALDINASLATFKMFTDFAQQRVDEGKGKSIFPSIMQRI